MSGKNQYPFVANWQPTSPVTGFLPNNPSQNSGGSAPSGTISGAMASTNTIYSQIFEVSKMDNTGLEVTWTGTPTGTFQVMVSNSAINFYALTFSPALTQPAGSSGGYAIDLNQVPFKYMMFQYANASGTGTLTIYGQNKDLN